MTQQITIEFYTDSSLTTLASQDIYATNYIQVSGTTAVGQTLYLNFNPMFNWQQSWTIKNTSGSILYDSINYPAQNANPFLLNIGDIISNTNIITFFVINSDFVLKLYPTPLNSNICFPATTPIQTDQGFIPIELIDSDKHTINHKKIVQITRTISTDKHLVCFEKNSVGKNIPSIKTVMSRRHKIFYNGEMRMAIDFVGNDDIYEIKYKGEVLYNVLMETHNTMQVNNLTCETLDPTSEIAKLLKKRN